MLRITPLGILALGYGVLCVYRLGYNEGVKVGRLEGRLFEESQKNDTAE